MSNSNRILFIDNLRSMVVILVIILHVALSYSNLVPWWCVEDIGENTLFFDNLIVLFDVFLMPALFFIAGYFAFVSFKSKGLWGFLKRKFRRLGLPLLIVIPIISPAFSYIYNYSRGQFTEETSYLSYCKNYMYVFFDFKIGIQDMVSQFNHYHLWFISLLLFFFIIFALYAHLKMNKDIKNNPKPTKNPLIIISIVSLLFIISTGAGMILFPNSGYAPWVNVYNLLIFQPSKVISYFLYFLMGIYAFRKEWFVKIKIPGHTTLWSIALILLSVLYILTVKNIMIKSSLMLFILFLTFRALLCISFLVTLTKLAEKGWNSPSKINSTLSENSYNVYLIHFLFVIVLQLAFSYTGFPTLLKFTIISILSVSISFIMSQYLIKPFQSLSIISFKGKGEMSSV